MIMEKILAINPNYTVFSDGRIFSKISGKFLKPWKTNKGYPIVSLFDGKGGHKFYLLHRLIATAFIPNPENKPCVDHLDCNRENCAVENLRWVTYSENNRNPITVKGLAHGNSMRGRFGQNNPLSKRVLCYTRNGDLVKCYGGVHEASRETGINKGDIGACCRGKRKTAGNYIWKYDN